MTNLDPAPRRGAIAVVCRDARLLVIRRSVLVVAPRALCFPGGGIRQGETESQAVVREFREELGAAVQPVRRLWTCVTERQVHLGWWLAALPGDAILTPDPAEVESVHWMTLETLRQAPDLLPSNHGFLEAVRLGQVEGVGF